MRDSAAVEPTVIAGDATGHKSWASRIAPETALAAIPLGFLALLFLYPLADTVVSSIGSDDPLEHYKAVFENDFFVRAAVRTLFVSTLCVVISLLLAYPIAYEVTRPRTRMRVVLLGVVIVTFWISILIRAYSWVAILEPGGVLNDFLRSLSLIETPVEFEGNIWGVTIGMTHFLLPYMVLVLIPSVRGVSPELVAAARSLGANRLHTFRRVFLPMTANGIAAGCLLTFILSIGFFVMPAVLAGPGLPFVSNIVGEQVGRFQEFELAAAMGVSLTMVVVVLYVILLRVADPTKILAGDGE